MLGKIVATASRLSPGILPPQQDQNIQKKPLSLQEAVSLALHNNKDIEIFRQNVLIAEVEGRALKNHSPREVELAKRNAALADAKFRQAAIETISKVVSAYWELAYAFTDLHVHEENLRMTRELLALNRLYAARGQLDQLDIVSVELQEANQILAVYDTRATWIQSGNALKYLIAANRADPLWEMSLIPTDNDSEVSVGSISLSGALKEAIENRLELKLNTIEDEINQINQSFYKESNRKADLERSVSESRKLKAQREQLELQIEVEVRNTMDKLRNADARVRAAREARQAFEQVDLVEQKALKTGESNTKLILASQTLMFNARLVEIRATAERRQVFGQLQRATATTLSINQ